MAAMANCAAASQLGKTNMNMLGFSPDSAFLGSHLHAQNNTFKSSKVKKTIHLYSSLVFMYFSSMLRVCASP